jgi:hypothetical protein
MVDAALTLEEGESISLFAYQPAVRGNICIKAWVHQHADGRLIVTLDTQESGNDTVLIEVQHGVITKFERKD